MDTTSTIRREVVPEHQRSAITEKLFGLHFPLCIEPLIFHITSTIAKAPAYTGGYWRFYTLELTGDDDRGFYMAPDTEDVFDVQCEGNFWSGTLSADALGIVACLTAYSHLSFSRDVRFGQLMAAHFHRLRVLALEHPEATGILGAID